MNSPHDPIYIYLGVHAITTVAALIGFLVRNENRITKVETLLSLLKHEHDRYTAMIHKIRSTDETQNEE